jgi:hypothetical protein
MNTTSWTPQITLDLNTVSARAFNEKLAEFDKWRLTQSPRSFDISNGWKTITPEIAEAMLLSNPLSANRRPTLSTAKYYARQMREGKWRKTGQPIIFTKEGDLLDAGHRLWACYLSNVPFETYLVGDVEDSEHDLFAFIDAGKGRSAADALATAGLNGQSRLLAQVVNIAAHYEQGLYTASAEKQMEKMSPSDVIDYVKERPNLSEAVRLMASDYRSANNCIDHRDVAAFAAFGILDLYGIETLDKFMNELGTVEIEDPKNADADPIVALAIELEKDKAHKRKDDKMRKHQVLGRIIKGFNYWVKGDSVKKLTFDVSEKFPHFLPPPEEVQEAAE